MYTYSYTTPHIGTTAQGAFLYCQSLKSILRLLAKKWTNYFPAAVPPHGYYHVGYYCCCHRYELHLDTGKKTAQLWTGEGWKLERKLLGSFRSDWELPVLEPSHQKHKGGEEKQVQQAPHLRRTEVQSQVRLTAAGLPGDLPPVHHKWATPENL